MSHAAGLGEKGRCSPQDGYPLLRRSSAVPARPNGNLPTRQRCWQHTLYFGYVDKGSGRAGASDLVAAIALLDTVNARCLSPANLLTALAHNSKTIRTSRSLPRALHRWGALKALYCRNVRCGWTCYAHGIPVMTVRSAAYATSRADVPVIASYESSSPITPT